MLAILGIPSGILLLIAGGAALVAGASQVAERLGVSPMIIGLTIVGFGTSTPELIVNVLGAIRGETALAFGNVVGSNISNLALVLGAAALFQPITIQSDLVRREIPLLLLATTIIMVMALDGVLEGLPARIGRSDSVVLFVLFGIFIYLSVLNVLRTREPDPIFQEIQQHPPITQTAPSNRWMLPLIIFGFAGLYLGGEITIRSSVALSESLGISTTVIGLFVIAVGTSMPELVTSIIAAWRKESDLALGNVVGSNIFNSLIVLPAGGVLAAIPIPAGGIQDLTISWLLTAALIPAFFLGKAQLGRTTGIALLAVYVIYAAYRVFTG